MTNTGAILTKVVTTSGSVGFATLFALTQETQQALLVLTSLIIIDFLTGLIKSWQLRETSSDGMARGMTRKGTLVIIPLTISLLGSIVNLDMTLFLTWTISILACSEAYSIIANIYTIRTGKKAKEYDAVSIILKRIGDIIDGLIINK